MKARFRKEQFINLANNARKYLLKMLGNIIMEKSIAIEEKLDKHIPSHQRIYQYGKRPEQGRWKFKTYFGKG